MIDMQTNTKLWASVSGVAITAAVVVGAVLGTTGGSHEQRPAGNVGGAAPATVTATVTAPAPAPASPAATVVVKVSPSTKKAASPKKRQAVARQQQQEAPVTDPTPPADNQPPADDAPTTEPDSQQPLNNGGAAGGPRGNPVGETVANGPDGS